MNIALIAHDEKKIDIVEWSKFNKLTLSKHTLYATGTTGKLISDDTGLSIIRKKSGPYGGDQEIGSMIANKQIDILIFFWDPLDAHPHDPDVKALLRLAVLYNIPTACNRNTADFIISSQMFKENNNG
jgi:methylglyoxal synthase